MKPELIKLLLAAARVKDPNTPESVSRLGALSIHLSLAFSNASLGTIHNNGINESLIAVSADSSL